jgi:peptide/nickel transport system permease protein
VRNYIIRRTFYSLILLFLAASLIFWVLNLTPGSPYARIWAEFTAMGRKLPPQSHMDALDRLLGLDAPIYQRYVLWLKAVFSGTLGTSWSVQTGYPVLDIVMHRVPYTLLLMASAALVAVVVAVPAGLYSALRPYSTGDFIVLILTFFGMSMPAFVLGTLLIAVFGLTVNWLPVGGVASRELIDKGDIVAALGRIATLGLANKSAAGYEGRLILDGAKHLLLPTITLALFPMARWSRYVRVAVLDVLNQDYVRTALAFGVPEARVVRRHVLRNALIPVITVIALDIPALFTGAVVTEVVFQWPGIGRLYMDGLRWADWPLLQGLLIINTGLVVFANFAVDIFYSVVDPRITYS